MISSHFLKPHPMNKLYKMKMPRHKTSETYYQNILSTFKLVKTDNFYNYSHLLKKFFTTRNYLVAHSDQYTSRTRIPLCSFPYFHYRNTHMKIGNGLSHHKSCSKQLAQNAELLDHFLLSF